MDLLVSNNKEMNEDLIFQNIKSIDNSIIDFFEIKEFLWVRFYSSYKWFKIKINNNIKEVKFNLNI